MNERIKELAAKAGFGPTNDPHVRQSFDVNLFAELIVKECITVVENTDKTQAYTTYDLAQIEGTMNKCVKNIKEHFGVT